MFCFTVKDTRLAFTLAHIKVFVLYIIRSCGISMRHFLLNGVAELIATEALAFLYSTGVTDSHSPRDTLQMNLITERWVRSLKENVVHTVAFIITGCFLVSCS